MNAWLVCRTAKKAAHIENYVPGLGTLLVVMMALSFVAFLATERGLATTTAREGVVLRIIPLKWDNCYAETETGDSVFVSKADCQKIEVGQNLRYRTHIGGVVGFRWHDVAE